MSEININSLKCSNCGAPLVMQQSSLRRVICPYCGSENIIEGAEKNTEILSKENIMGGVPLELSDPQIHKMIVDQLCKSECPPLDVFTETNVKKVRKIIVPAYWFDNCTGSGTAQYEKGVEREHQEIVGKGNDMRTVTKKHIEWTPMSMAINDTSDFIVSGNKEYSEILRMLYLNKQNPDITDIEEIDYPAESIALKYNVPDAVVFNQYIKPIMENVIEAKAKSIISGDNVRNIQLVGTSIQKGEMRRISIGIYEIIFEYKGREYKLYFSNNGENVLFDALPVDNERKELIQQKEKAIRSFHSPLAILFTVLGSIGCGLGGLLFIVGVMGAWACIPIGLILVGGGVVAFIYMSKERNKYLVAKRAMQAELDEIKQQFDLAKQQFISAKVALKGVLISLTGNSEAF